ncbi:MAG: RDD family protein, partial [Candidatus Dormibacteraeota bacterium]|nr:RDD family protein [Candidatus Dormibacteraeota bacterium]
SWALREVSPDPVVSLGAAQAALEAEDGGATREAAVRAARLSPRGLGVTLLPRVTKRGRAYAEWFVWARRELGVSEPARLHQVAQAALARLDTGASAESAAAAAAAVAGADRKRVEAGAEVDHRDSDPFDIHAVPLPEPPSRPALMYGAFVSRFVAYVLDGVVLLIISLIATVVASLAVRFSTFGQGLFLGVFLVVVGWIYYAVCESSSLQATLGKAAMGVVVTDTAGRRISFGRATLRYWSRVLLSGILLIGYLLALFTPQKRALHDYIAGTLVAKREYAPLIAAQATPATAYPPPPLPMMSAASPPA